jgi:hypothetical protein
VSLGEKMERGAAVRFAFCRARDVPPEAAVEVAETAAGPDGRAVWETQIEKHEVFVWWLPDGSRILGFMPGRAIN